MQRAYKLSVIYYLAFAILLVISAIMLFKLKIGFSIESILEYYIGNEEKFIAARNTGAIFKMILPHIYVFGLLSMVLLHFIVFTKHRFQKSTIVLIWLTFTNGLLEIFTPFAIINGLAFFAYIKLLSFIIFLALILYIIWLLFNSIIND